MVIPRAIVVDDESDIAEIFSDLLDLIQVKVVGIGYTGIDAIRLVKAQKPDIVFMDIHMPKMNGIEAMEEIKKLFPSTSVVIITSDRYADEKKLLQSGAADIIYKPFEMDQIQRVFEKLKAKIVL